MPTKKSPSTKQSGISIPRLRSQIKGRVIAPDDDGYDQARRVNAGGVDRRPAVIIRVADTDDVARVIALAQETGLDLAVRSGGHSSAGHGTCEGGILLDLADLRSLDIDPLSRTAWAGTGLTAGELTTAAAEHGLAVGFGDTGSVGIGGITLGGGVGYLVRKHGLTIDNLLAAEIVTADGQCLHVDGDTHPDLFWAIRGGGGNFGVATRFQYRLHPLETVLGGILILPAEPEVISGFIREAEAAPDEFSAIVNIMPAPPMPFLPSGLQGQLIVMVMLLYAGDPASGEPVLARFRSLAAPLADMVRPIRYPEMYPPEQAGDGPNPLFAAHNMFMDSVDTPTAEIMLAALKSSSAMMPAVQLRVLGGAMARVPAEATAFAHRASRIMVNLAAIYMDPAETPTHQAWIASLASSLRQSDPGAYVNFLGAVSEAEIRTAYPGPAWDRLRQVKSRYDPGNLFHLNQNIPPA